MFALVDCNNFYASCERVFNPYWNDKPVVVLSNNDGCVIARSNEAKTLGIKMGIPAYQIKDEIEKHHIGVFSSNYTLYGDMSNRVMTLLASYSPCLEIYSIDEAFLDLADFDLFNLKEYGEDIVQAVTRGTGIPISMGIAPTKTLAKVANKFAKRFKGYKGVCIIDSEEKRIEALKRTEIGGVWGQICTSRAFGETITGIDGLEEAVSTFASLCTSKLRSQRSCAQSLMVFIHTNNFREDLPQYFKNYVIKLPVPTNSTPGIVHYALVALRNIYRKGYHYKKAGVIIMDISPDRAIQGNIFDTVDRVQATEAYGSR